MDQINIKRWNDFALWSSTVLQSIALHNLLKKNKKITAVFSGEGGTSEGDFHEALNVASVWNLPVIFVIENNGYGLSTPVNEQYNCKNISDKGIGYGIKSYNIDGNNIIEVFSKIKEIKKIIQKKPQPVLVELMTFRIRGHEEASGTKYVPKEMIEYWEKRDPILNYESFLLESDILNKKEIKKLKKQFSSVIEDDIKKANLQSKIAPSVQKELNDVLHPYDNNSIKKIEKSTEMRFVDSISNALKLSMEKYDELIIMGQDIAEYGGVFKVTDGFLKIFGKDRVRNTPICESSIIETAMGLSIVEKKYCRVTIFGFHFI